MSEDKVTDFVKSVAEADRLRIIGLLAIKPCRLSEINDLLALHPADTFHHLEQLIRGGITHLSGGLYELDEQALESLARRQFKDQRPVYVPAPDLENRRRQVLAAHLNPDGTIKAIPLHPDKRQIILDHLINAFFIGANYTEKEVNLLLAHFHPDTAALRRYLVDAGMLKRERDGSRYWRPK